MIIQCLLLIFIEAVQLRQRHFKYFKEWDNYFQLTCFVLIIAFVAPGFTNNCWCAHNGQWQIGAFALCLGWFNLIVLLKDMPCTAVPVNMFINICITFLKLLFLPFLLLLAFAFPFYMVFARTANSFEVWEVILVHIIICNNYIIIPCRDQTLQENLLHSDPLLMP